MKCIARDGECDIGKGDIDVIMNVMDMSIARMTANLIGTKKLVLMVEGIVAGLVTELRGTWRL